MQPSPDSPPSLPPETSLLLFNANFIFKLAVKSFFFY
jgi:hypothetical protein